MLEVFRDIEKKVIGAEAAVVRDDASTRAAEDKTGQMSLLKAPPASDARYESLHEEGLREGPRDLIGSLTTHPIEFAKLWPKVLENRHITKSELARGVWDLHRADEIVITNAKPRERTTNDKHLLSKK